MRVDSGTRAGLWRPGSPQGPFIELGRYIGPVLPDPIIGAKFEQKLMEGTVTFSVGVLFRPDLDRRHRLETIIIIDDGINDMWDYDTWEKTEDQPHSLIS